MFKFQEMSEEVKQCKTLEKWIYFMEYLDLLCDQEDDELDIDFSPSQDVESEPDMAQYVVEESITRRTAVFSQAYKEYLRDSATRIGGMYHCLLLGAIYLYCVCGVYYVTIR
jgi:hypothetical protein